MANNKHIDQFLLQKIHRLAKTWDKDALAEYFAIDKKTLESYLKMKPKEDKPASDEPCKNC